MLYSCTIEKVDKYGATVYSYKLTDNNGKLETIIEDVKPHTKTICLAADKKVV